MITNEPIVADAGAQSNPASMDTHEMRITDHGKIHSFVSFALRHLQENPQRPLILHTFPILKKSCEKQHSSARPEVETLPEPDNHTETRSAGEPPKKKCKIATATATIPRLVSVVEIIRREYAKWALARQSSDGRPADNTLRMGLHQYNELATLEDLGIVESKEHGTDETEQLRMALEGKNFLKQKFTPHLKVTLSVNALPELEKRGATHQPPQPVKRSKTARARERKRQKRKDVEEVVTE